MKIINPFYAALMVVGLVFALTTCAYTVMTSRKLDPLLADEPGLTQVMEHHGVKILGGELAILAVLTFAAIGTDDFWTRRHEAAKRSSGN
ncbi:hypothetical protein ETAA8_55030 [Anatilimnocola aggregata]|uniref:Uncharacterized protein n=1 Tax=Anatilimnocola aggregata TaxID=2528021 RepID=A0A517YJI8_9BACT|nr:hypothetical protein [Anatilimnocola aggregata]QDU30375.1 hypothetical protein ETAA8_55030 [Anatilimnocola aggregata]